MDSFSSLVLPLPCPATPSHMVVGWLQLSVTPHVLSVIGPPPTSTISTAFSASPLPLIQCHFYLTAEESFQNAHQVVAQCPALRTSLLDATP